LEGFRVQELESSSDDSVSEWIEDLKDGKERAAAKLWNRFFRQIRSLARSKLGAVPGAARDEEDVALSTLQDVFSGAQEGRFERLENRNDFWQLVTVILSRKALNVRRALLARRETSVSDLTNLENEEEPLMILEKAAQDRPYEYDLDSLGIECEELLGMLDERLQRIALLKLAGLTNEEIAASLSRHVTSIERALQTIRGTWKSSLP
jgi:DNA-directed RNA polymerase specialized sigma24 family protein